MAKAIKGDTSYNSTKLSILSYEIGKAYITRQMHWKNQGGGL